MSNATSKSDSSEDEDLSRFKDVVDTSFVISINKSIDTLAQAQHLPSDRFLSTSTHYNDVKVSEELQKKIGAKITAILDKSIEFIDVHEKPKKHKIKGGVKLFSDSESFMSAEEPTDTYTKNHNCVSKKIKQNLKKRQREPELDTLSESEKLNLVAVNGDYVLSMDEIKCWKSRRKEKLYKYKGNKNVLTAVE